MQLNRQKTGFILASFLVFAVLIAMTVRNEYILASDDRVLVALAPADPRSLMQGDYMRLAYALEQDVRNAKHPATRGALVVTVDANRIAVFSRIDDGKPLAANERLLHFRDKLIHPRSFFFQEGHAGYYEKARYGIFSYASSGDYLLSGLADADKNTISPAGSVALK